jgi:aryl-alcohol dehydrogenase-like predicted oxidoreductase
VIGARNEEQLRQNLEALSFTLSPSHARILESASDVTPIMPYWHQRGFSERNPFPT